MIAVLLAAGSLPSFAQAPDLIDADRPGLADASTVVGKGWLQVETGFQWEEHPGQTAAFFPTLFRIGLADRFEARFEGNTFVTVSAEDQRQSGLAPASIGFEWLVSRRSGRRPGLGIIGRVSPAWGTGDFVSRHVTSDARLAADWDFADHWSLNPNVGVAAYEADAGDFVAGLLALTLAFAPRDGVSWFVDSGVQMPEAEGGTTSVVVDGGVAYICGRNWQVDLSAGTRVHGETAPHPFVAIGLAYRHKSS